MERKYIVFHTGKAALFLFYAVVILLLALFYAKITQSVPEENLLGGSVLYLAIVTYYAFRVDRTIISKSSRE